MLRHPEFLDNRHLKVISISALDTFRHYPPRNIPGTNFCKNLNRTQGRKYKVNDLIGNRTQDLPPPPCSAVPGSTASPPTPYSFYYNWSPKHMAGWKIIHHKTCPMCFGPCAAFLHHVCTIRVPEYVLSSLLVLSDTRKQVPLKGCKPPYG